MSHQPLSDDEIDSTDVKYLRLSYQALRREYEDVLFKLKRLTYVHEGPNGTPRDPKSVTPNSRLTATLGELVAKTPPIDDELDRRVAAKMRRFHEKQSSTKIR